jgi:hypothetical protein
MLSIEKEKGQPPESELALSAGNREGITQARSTVPSHLRDERARTRPHFHPSRYFKNGESYPAEGWRPRWLMAIMLLPPLYSDLSLVTHSG